jgi:hypothetical protein
LVLLLALGLHALLEPPSDAAYYLLWSRQPSLSYLDHPGAIAWLAWPWPDEQLLWAARLMPWLLALLDGLVLLALLRGLGHASKLAVAVFCSPAFLGSALLWTPDAPLILAWHFGLLFLVRRWHGSALLPVALALCASKLVGTYLLVLLVIARLRQNQQEARGTGQAPNQQKPKEWLWGVAALLLGAIVTWLCGTESLVFQSTRLGAAQAPSLWRLLSPLLLVAGLLALAGPGLMLAMVKLCWSRLRLPRSPTAPPQHLGATPPLQRRCTAAAARRAMRLGRTRRLAKALLELKGWMLGSAQTWRFLTLFSIGPFLLLAVLVRVELNWLLVGLLPLVFWAGAEKLVLSKAMLRLQVAAVVLLAALALAAPVAGHHPLRRLMGWRAWASSFPRAEAVLADRYQTASQLALYQQCMGSTFEAIEPSSALRPSALDKLDTSPLECILIIWDRKAPPALVGQQWPIVVSAGSVHSSPAHGPPTRTFFELRARSESACPQH